jgi:hypothetical protein
MVRTSPLSPGRSQLCPLEVSFMRILVSGYLRLPQILGSLADSTCLQRTAHIISAPTPWPASISRTIVPALFQP